MKCRYDDSDVLQDLGRPLVRHLWIRLGLQIGVKPTDSSFMGEKLGKDDSCERIILLVLPPLRSSDYLRVQVLLSQILNVF